MLKENSNLRRRVKMRIIKVSNYEALSKKAAQMIASQMILKPSSVLGLATGSTPIGTYEELIRMYNAADIDFKDIVTFNLDEYHGLSSENDQSYIYFMKEKLFRHVNINHKNIHIPNGETVNIDAECSDYDKKIVCHGGIDIQLLGIGRNGHIGFNEPDVKFEALTHLVDLDSDTIEANARFFDSIDQVPTKAISMGIKNIMHARKIVLVACGKEKAETIHKMVHGDIVPELPASVLQLHPDVTVIVDEDAGSLLSHM